MQSVNGEGMCLNNINNHASRKGYLRFKTTLYYHSPLTHHQECYLQVDQRKEPHNGQECPLWKRLATTFMWFWIAVPS